MADDEVVDAEAGTLNKQVSPLEHLRHLINIGWEDRSPLIQNFVSKHALEDELDQLIAQKNR
jgi:hypothetical protein